MSSFLVLRQLLTVGDLFAASALIMALAWLAPFRKTASLRHLVWVAGFAALLALPLLLLIVPSHFSFALAAPVAEAPQMAPMPVETSTITAPIVAASLPQPAAFHFDLVMLLRAATAIWLLGVAAIALRGIAALFALNRLRRNSVGHIFRDLPKFAAGYDIRIAPDECGPVTWGFVRPIILLPASADYWPTERVTAVLLHEIEHIRRRDSLTQMLSLVTCALYWPNPFVWMGARAMRREAEIAADDAVIVSGVRPSYYAAELVHLAAQFHAQRPALLNVPVNVPMAERAALEARVESILAQTKHRSGVTAMDVAKITVTGLAAAAALAFARPSLAQDVPSVPPAPPAMTAPAVPPIAAEPPPPPPAPVVQAELPAPPPPPPAAAIAPRDYQHVHIDSDQDTVDGRDHRHIHFLIDGHRVDLDTDDYASLSPEDRAKFDRAEAEARAHVEAMRPQIEAARAQALAAAEQLRQHGQEMRLQINAARAQARMAANEARVQATAAADQARGMRFEETIREVSPKLEKAIEEARAEVAKANIDVKIQEKIDRALRRVEVETRVHEHDTGPVDTIVVNQDDGSDNK